jgi:phage gp36-like protein
MSYGSTAGLNQKFGPNSVSKWADLNNDQNADEIAARIAAALDYADAEVNSHLARTHYRKPLVTAAGTVPAMVADIANALAGCWLKDARGQDTFDEQESPQDSLTWHRTQAYKKIEQIKSGEIRLDAI